MVPEVLYRVCFGTSTPLPSQTFLLNIKPAILHDYRCHQVRGVDYPALAPCSIQSSVPSSSTATSPISRGENLEGGEEESFRRSVRGTYVSGLTPGDMWRLDTFEGTEYERRSVCVEMLGNSGDEAGKENMKGEEAVAETYVWAGSKERLEDEDWDFEHFVEEKLAAWIDGRGSHDIEDVDDANKDSRKRQDPTGGRGTGGAITNILEGKEGNDVMKSAV